MAYSDIQQHFKGLRVQTGRRGRRDPFATGFEDDSDDDTTARRSRSKTKSDALTPSHLPSTSPSSATTSVEHAAPASHVKESARDSEDEFLDAPKRPNRQPSPAPVPRNRNRAAVALAAGPLAYLDDSSDEDELDPRTSPRRDRRPSPAPKSASRKSSDPIEPKDLTTPVVLPPRHTVASPFAGTKYLEDSESDSDEVAVSSRQGSTDSSVSLPRTESDDEWGEPQPTKRQHLEVKKVEKPKQHGSGVSWRAFSAGRAEQRSAEIEALQASLRKRGKSISFATHAATDDGQHVPVAAREKRGPRKARPNARDKSPPRRSEDVKPSEDEFGDGASVQVAIHDAVDENFGPLPDMPLQQSSMGTSSTTTLPATCRTSELTRSLTQEDESQDTNSPPDSGMADSADSIISRLTMSPQAIPEGRVVDHASSPLVSPNQETFGEISRNSSMRSLRMPSSRPTRIPNSRRSSRRSTSVNASASPAHAFLASWASMAEPTAEAKPDDEGQSIGLNNEYVIGRTISQGGFGVVKEVHSINEAGSRTVRAVKIVRKQIAGKGDDENDKIQQELEHEVAIWRYLKHPHILDLHAVYESDYATFCIMDLNLGGTLFDLVRIARGQSAVNDGRKSMEPRLAKRYAYQLASALRYLHEDMRVCHRDIKLENCLVDMSASDAGRSGGRLRLCDFGLADFLHSDQNLEDALPARFDESSERRDSLPKPSSVIGTLEYASPKGLCTGRKLYETAGDVWAFGVVIYALCTGELPFRHPIPSKTVELILHADWDIDALRRADAGGETALNLVRSCLERDIDMRATVGEVLGNAWFDDCHEMYDRPSPEAW